MEKIMGWGSGSEIFRSIIHAAIQYIPDVQQRKEFYIMIYPIFCENDWDTQEECIDDDFVFKELYNSLKNYRIYSE